MFSLAKNTNVERLVRVLWFKPTSRIIPARASSVGWHLAVGGSDESANIQSIPCESLICITVRVLYIFCLGVVVVFW